ncbi:MAG: hypothetical protein HN976_34620 [Lentisphaerae bacterium]|nr:hypothetical protein [Lentisphaerota bacterium]MBT7060283.1 hypothetical protein [Lentisphaerota bacterium]
MGTLKLIDHPEGGRYHEVFRSDATVRTENGPSRSALTHIYFSLDAGERSRFHRVAGDEVWNLYEGVGIRLYLWDGSAISGSLLWMQEEGSATFSHSSGKIYASLYCPLVASKHA